MSASSDVVVKSELSMAPHDNFNTVTRIPENSEVQFAKPERVSPAPSCLSMRSDTSMGQPINFKKSVIHRMKQDRGVSPAVSNVSMKSDWSMDHPFNFKRELTTPDSGVGASPAPSCLSMKSDTSMAHPCNFKREITTPDLGVGVSPAPSCLFMRSDKSMGHLLDLRECLINEFSSSLLTSVYARCCLCSSILKNPISIPCGHSYCEHCINMHWSQPGPTGDYVCPQCKKSYPLRPVLSVNVALNWMLQVHQQTGFGPACPTLPQAGPGDVACDICSSLKLRAVKTCVTCCASYCENHVRQHYTVPALQKHTLVQVNEDTRLSQWEENSGEMEDIKEESFVDSESEEHQEVACKRMKMDVINEDEIFQHGSLEHSDLKNVSTHLQPEQEKDLPEYDDTDDSIKLCQELEPEQSPSSLDNKGILSKEACIDPYFTSSEIKYSAAEIEWATSVEIGPESTNDLPVSPEHSPEYDDTAEIIRLCQELEPEQWPTSLDDKGFLSNEACPGSQGSSDTSSVSDERDLPMYTKLGVSLSIDFWSKNSFYQQIQSCSI